VLMVRGVIWKSCRVVNSVKLAEKAQMPPAIDSKPDYIAKPAVMPVMSIMPLQDSP
jgi:hypothetical protein